MAEGGREHVQSSREKGQVRHCNMQATCSPVLWKSVFFLQSSFFLSENKHSTGILAIFYAFAFTRYVCVLLKNLFFFPP